MLIFNADYRSGSLVDKVNGIVPTQIGSTPINKGDKGLQLDMFGSSLQYIKSLSGVYDVVMAVNYSSKTGTWDYLADFRIGGTGYIYCSHPIVLSSGTLYVDNVTYTSSSKSINDNKWHLVIVSGMSITSTTTCINENQGGGSNSISKHLFCKIYDNRLTEQERASLYKDFLNSYPQSKEKYPNVINKPMDLSREVNNTYTDIPQTWLINSGTPTVDGQTLTIPVSSSVYCANSPGRYRITCEVTNYSGGSGVILPYDGSSRVTIDGGTSLKTANGVYSYDYNLTGNALFIATYPDTSATVRIITIQKVTGLVAAYSFVPQGNTLVDISGNGHTATKSGQPMATKNGIKFKDGSLDGYTISAINFGTIHTQCIRVKLNRLSGDHDLGFCRSGNAMLDAYNGLSIWYNASNISGSVNYTFDTNWHDWATVRNGTSVTFYIDGISIGNFTLTSNPDLIVDSIQGLSTLNADCEIQDLRIYNRALTLSEVKAYHNQFVQPTLVETFDEGADGVSKVPSGWVKQSGEFKIGELQIARASIISNGGFDTDSVWGKASGCTISNGVGHINKSSDVAFLQSTTNTVIGKKYKVSFTISNYVSGGVKIYIGTTYGQTTYRSGNGTSVYYLTNDTTNGNLNIYADASTICDIDNVIFEEVSPLPTLQNGSKYLECVTGGSIAIPSKQAYGTWEFDIYHGGAGQPFIQFLNDKLPFGKSYSAYFNTGQICFYNTDALTLLNGTAGGCANNTWYRIKVTRTTTGIFTCYIKGGQYGVGDWSLIPISTGNNPFTNNTSTISEYFTLTNFLPGDRIANIILTDGIKQ